MGFEAFAGRNRRQLAGLSPDWHGLRVRLSAAHAARRALLAGFAQQGAANGSFDPAAATSIFAFEEALAAVNLTDLADGKSVAGNELGVAGAQVPGGRG